jgi:hypothetical protein
MSFYQLVPATSSITYQDLEAFLKIRLPGEKEAKAKNAISLKTALYEQVDAIQLRELHTQVKNGYLDWKSQFFKKEKKHFFMLFVASIICYAVGIALFILEYPNCHKKDFFISTMVTSGAGIILASGGILFTMRSLPQENRSTKWKICMQALDELANFSANLPQPSTTLITWYQQARVSV